MRVMVLVKANKESEAGTMPDEKILPTWESSMKSCGSRRDASGRRTPP